MSAYKQLIGTFLIVLSMVAHIKADIITIGAPYIQNFSKREYLGGTQNWSIAQDISGFMYFANNEGLLYFDGVRWETYRMPNFSIVRSVFINKDATVYVGAYNEFGKMITAQGGRMQFKSLKKYLPGKYHSFDDIWNITTYENQIVFQCYKYAFLYRNDSTVSVVEAPSRFQNSYLVNDRLYFNDQENGLMEYKNQTLVALKGCEKIKGEEIWSVLPINQGNSIMIFTLSKGIFIYNGNELKEWITPINELLKQKQIFSAGIIQKHFYGIGTIRDGLYIADQSGNIVKHLNKQEGLQNNTILKIFSDRVGNLWLGLDNGIDYLNMNSPITFLQQAEGIGAGYTSIIYKGKIYMGTNQGLFVSNWNNRGQNEEFRLISGTNGQVWYLGVHDGVLLCGQNKGAFIIEGETARQICTISGVWKFLELKRFPGYLIGGTYSGLIFFKKQNNSWVYCGKIKGFNESFRIFEEDENGDLWMSHGFKGIYKISFSDKIDSISSVSFYTKQDGLPSNYNMNVFKIKNRIIISTISGIYEYSTRKGYFEPSMFFNQLFSSTKQIAYLKEDQSGSIWYVATENGKNKAGVFRIQEDNSYKRISAPFDFLSGKLNGGFESIYCYSDDHIFFGTTEGFAHYSPTSTPLKLPKFEAFINQATAIHLDSVFFDGHNFNSETTSYTNSNKYRNRKFNFPFKDNKFRFSYTSPAYESQDNVEYSFKLIGYDSKWSEWSNVPSNEYTKLPPGDYTFIVKARTQVGIESSTNSIEFTISPPWYSSIWAQICYGLVLTYIILFSVWYLFKRIELSKRKEKLTQLKQYRRKEQEYRREAFLAEKEIINLKNEKLKIEMIHRDKELANQTMGLIHKNKLLTRIQDDLEKIKQSTSDDLLRDKIAILTNKINKEIDHKKQWEVFETAFDEVHDDFLSRLKEQYPNLTPKELKLCAYLRMNISTKEIAQLMNISVRGVEICRYRVRKKLNIGRDQNLTSLIIDL